MRRLLSEIRGVRLFEFRDTVAEALLAQRRTQQAPLEVDDSPGCVPNVVPASLLPMRQLDLATAALCLLPDGRRFRRVDLDQSLVARLEDTLHGESTTTVARGPQAPSPAPIW